MKFFLQYSRHACCYSAPHLAPDTLPILSVIFGTRVTVLESKCARTDLKETWMNTGACAAQGCRSQGDCRAVQNLHQLRYDETSAAAAAATAASIWKELYIQSVGRLLQRLILRAGLLLGGRNKIASMEQLTSLGAYRQGAFPSRSSTRGLGTPRERRIVARASSRSRTPAS